MLSNHVHRGRRMYAKTFKKAFFYFLLVENSDGNDQLIQPRRTTDTKTRVASRENGQQNADTREYLH